jgi:peroxiredoxin
MTLLHFYRGRFCSVCREHLTDIAQHRQDFAARDITLMCVSADKPEDAVQSAAESGLSVESMAGGLRSPDMGAWGLFISEGGGNRPLIYCEPATFLIRHGHVYWASVQSLPWGSPRSADLLMGIDFMASRDFALRGNVH